MRRSFALSTSILFASVTGACGTSDDASTHAAVDGAPRVGAARDDAALSLHATTGDEPSPDAPTVADEGGGEASDSSLRDAAGDAGRIAALGFVAGTNLSGAEFGSGKIPGVRGQDYTYPTHAEIDSFTGKGFRIFRIPFLWERMQRTLGGPLDATQLGYLADIVGYATSKGAYAILDPHDYARYGGQLVGAAVDAGVAPVSAANFAAFWAKLATAFASNPRVVFGLMNEPNSMRTELWLDDANAAIAAIRGQAHATNVIFVPGNGWTGAHSWTSNSYGTPNATVMLGIVDPLSNYVIEVHQYLDSDYSGTSAVCASKTVGSAALASFTDWLRTNRLRGFLGEFGAADNATCTAALSDMLSYVDGNRDVWTGWTWWSAGPWWGTYMYSLEPSNGKDAPQLATLLPHL